MQLFTFGHPCEHQLRRVCIGGTSCPLNGYPDHWCCSFIKGRINFKRDKPCEGNRCRWGFAHPPVSSFEAVTLVLQEGRACAAKIEEGYGTGSLHGAPFAITSPHAADVAHCALNMLRVPPMRVAPRVGGLLAYAAVRAGDAKVFTQLLKTVKKPVDDYLIGAHEYIVATSRDGKSKLSKADLAVLDDLRHDVLSIMGPALSHQGELIHRPEQLPLQSYYLSALKGATRNKKKFADALEAATAKFPAAASNGGKLVPPASWANATAGPEADAAAVDDSASSSFNGDAKTPQKQPAAAAATTSPAAKPAHATTTPSAAQTDSKKGKQANSAATAPVVGSKAAPTQATASTDKKAAKPASAASSAQSSPAAPAKPAAGKTAAPTTTTTQQQQQPASAAVSRPTLLTACDTLGSDPAFAFNDFPGVASIAYPQPEPPASVFGGLFSLDINAARCGPLLEVATVGRREAPLGAATREGDTIAAWRSNAEQLAASETNQERREELQAAASALAAADVVLEAMSAGRQ